MSEQEPMHGERRWRHREGVVCPIVEIYIADGANSRWATPEAYWQAQAPKHGDIREYTKADGTIVKQICLGEGLNAYWNDVDVPDTSDIPEATEAMFARAQLRLPITPSDWPPNMSPHPEPYVAMQLKQKAELYKQRTALYSREGEPPGYTKRGPLLQLLLGNVQLNTPHDHARYAQFVWLAEKLHRYATNFTKGGHADSLDDISVIAMMLKELDENGPTT